MTSSQRYSRQMLLPGFGADKQQRLFDAKILVIGAGGLSCPALLYLAAAGVGHLGIIDFDTVEISNLHRQVLYQEQDLGKAKAEVAASKIRGAYPDTHVTAYNTRLDTHNALDILLGYDVVADGSDNFPTRYLVNDACVLLGKPLVYGSVYRYEGQVAVFNFPPNPVNYQIFSIPPAPDEVPNCAEAGVLGVLPGIIGSLQANEAIKLVTGVGEPLAGKLLTYHSLHNSFYEVELNLNPAARLTAPSTPAAFRAMQYAILCGQSPSIITEIDADELRELADQPDTLLVDVRFAYETPKLEDYPVLNIPLPELATRLPELERADRVIFFCQGGSRSLKAAELLAAKNTAQQIFSLKGGMMGWPY